MEDYVNIGVFRKPHALNGEVKIHLVEGYEEDFSKASILFTHEKGKPFPHFIEKITFGNQVIVKLEEVDTPEAAKRLNGLTAYLKASEVTFVQEATLDFRNYKVIDAQLGELGLVKEVVEYPEQMMGVIEYQNKEVLLPLVEAFIQEVNQEAKILEVDLPEGLVDL